MCALCVVCLSFHYVSCEKSYPLSFFLSFYFSFFPSFSLSSPPFILSSLPCNPLIPTQASVVVQPWMSPSCSLVSFAAVTESITTGAPSSPSTLAPSTLPLSTQTPGEESTTHSSIMSGGVSPADVQSAGVQQAAMCAVVDLNARLNSVYQTQLVSIISATQQVVSGIKYVITFTAGVSTQCYNDGSAPDLSQCPVAANAARTYQVCLSVCL